MRNWLHYCGFAITECKKSIYVDGHEREDVVKVRHTYFNGLMLMENQKRHQKIFLAQSAISPWFCKNTRTHLGIVDQVRYSIITHNNMSVAFGTVARTLLSSSFKSSTGGSF